MTTREYKKLRNARKDLASKILSWKEDQEKRTIYAGRKLDMLEGKTLVLNSEEDGNFLFDFILYEESYDSNRLIDLFYDSEEEVTEIEEELLEGMVEAYFSLFKMKSFDYENNLIELTDLLNPGRSPIRMMDLGFIKSARENMLIFTRLAPIKDIHMTTGASFVFAEETEKRLLKELSLEKFKKGVKFNSANLFSFAYQRSIKYGIKVITQDPD